ncbi:MAG: MvaI/BcnI family restriction endonuclease [Chitinispirillaceae bacterium]|jgi:hypothetical protein
MNFNTLLRFLRSNYCTKLYAKELAENDNSKNQIYLGSDFSAITILPYQHIDKSDNAYKAKVELYWLNEEGKVEPAVRSQIILYPQYPEVRFSGFLSGCHNPPSTILTARESGRILFFGITDDRKVIGFAVAKNDPLAEEFRRLKKSDQVGVFYNLTSFLAQKDIRNELIVNLRSIHEKGWIKSKRLDSNHNILPCKAPNCGGYTLEAEFGIVPNGKAEPDYHGWELKQHSVTAFTRYLKSIITLMTPEPTGGYYKTEGVIPFVKKYGYKDKLGRTDRYNFGGLHKANVTNPSTGLTLSLIGFDSRRSKISDINGGIALVSKNGSNAALWGYEGLLSHWNKKHSNAVYVPSVVEKNPYLQYWFGNIIRLGRGTDFILFLNALAEGKVYYDPGIKVEKISSKRPTTKRRSQFRIKSEDIPTLYKKMEVLDLLQVSP